MNPSTESPFTDIPLMLFTPSGVHAVKVSSEARYLVGSDVLVVEVTGLTREGVPATGVLARVLVAGLWVAVEAGPGETCAREFAGYVTGS